MRCALLLPLLCLWLFCQPVAVLSAEAGARETSPLLDVAPAPGWKAAEEAPDGMFAGCRHYVRTDGLLELMACLESIDLAGNTDTGYRKFGESLIRGGTEGLLLLTPVKKGEGCGLFILLGPPESAWRRQEAAPMLAAFAGAFAVPDVLLAKPIDPASYLGLFSFEEQGREDELGCTVYVRALPGAADGKLLAAILPYSDVWLDRPELLAALESFWGKLTPEGEHWTAGPKRHAALAADGKALCLLMAVADEKADVSEPLRQAMRELAAFVW